MNMINDLTKNEQARDTSPLSSDEIILSRSEFIEKLHAVGRERYHHQHPFHLLMHQGVLTQFQMQVWALNRYYYQSIIPIKDAIVLSRATDSEFRRVWRKRIEDHDGPCITKANSETNSKVLGGIEKWIQLAEATGLDRELVISEKLVLPAVKFAVNAYLDLVTNSTFLEAVASSLTELFSTKLISVRIRHLNELYPWMSHGLTYFQDRLTQAPEDAEFALNYVCVHAKTRAEQNLCIQALETKCNILWAQLDAIYFAYVSPGLTPPGGYSAELCMTKKPGIVR